MILILASSSPRRAEILRAAGIEFRVRPVEIAEAAEPGESAERMVARLAWSKAAAAAALYAAAGEPAIVIGADTAVEVGRQILGKPRDAAHAREMLGRLSGRTHCVLTGVHLIRVPDRVSRRAVEKTKVTMESLSAEEIDEYVSTAEPLAKAGAYAIQGLGGAYISKVEGCYFNVVGLPLARLYGLLRSLGWSRSTQQRNAATETSG